MVMIDFGPTASGAGSDMIAIGGVGIVSPAGWGISALRSVISARQSIPTGDLARPGWKAAIQVRRVPASPVRFPFLSHARLRRSSAITRYSVAAAVEAMESATDELKKQTFRLGV